MLIHSLELLISGLPLGDLTTAAPIAQQTIHTHPRTDVAASADQKATSHFKAMLIEAIYVADAPEKHTLKDLQKAAMLLECDQKEHSRGQHCPPLAAAMERINARMTNLGQAIDLKARAAGIITVIWLVIVMACYCLGR